MDPQKVASQRTKYLRSPVVVLVWVTGDPDPVRRREDRDATAAAVQNLLLAATANGLASYWASISDHFHAPARAVAGVDDIHQLDASMPFGRVCAPEDIANVTAFLVSPDSDFVSGVTIPVTGGQLGGM